MKLQVRRKSGSIFTAEDTLEVAFDTDGIVMVSGGVFHKIELVSGQDVTHGGGGQADEYLHYKSADRDADDDGIIDYSQVEIPVVQQSEGVSVIRVVCSYMVKAEVDAYLASRDAYQLRAVAANMTPEHPFGPDGSFTELFEDVAPSYKEIKSGEITLEWTTDTFV